VSDLSPHSYRQRARDLGRDPEVTNRALEVQARIQAHGAYPILTLRHLALATGSSWKYLRQIASRQQDPYLNIERRKRNGTSRSISSPEPVLMDVQRWILERILVASPIHPSSFAYQQGKSIVKCAEAHRGARWLVKLDIHDFFHSISEKRAFAVFNQLGYPRLLSFELARICTRAVPTRWHHWPTFGRDGPPYPTHPEGQLPQGAPTSGMLANAVMFDLDAKIDALARSLGLVYTRYSDDLVFSSADDFSRRRGVALAHQVGVILQSRDLDLHRTKMRIVPPGSRHIVLGLLLAEGEVRLLPEFKRRLEVHIRGVRKFGIPAHAHHRKFESVLSMINHIDGCIAFANNVDEEYAAKLKVAWDEVLREQGYPV
jgi:RNA-directed DNA polymerase